MGWAPGSEPGTRDPSRGFENARLQDLRVPQHGGKPVDRQLCNSADARASPCLPGCEPDALNDLRSDGFSWSARDLAFDPAPIFWNPSDSERVQRDEAETGGMRHERDRSRCLRQNP